MSAHSSGNGGDGPQQLEAFIAWARGSLDVLRPHFMRMVFPLFVHSVLDAIITPSSMDSGVDSARFLLERYRALFEPQHAQVTAALAALVPMRRSRLESSHASSGGFASAESRSAQLASLFKSAVRVVQTDAAFAPPDRPLSALADSLTAPAHGAASGVARLAALADLHLLYRLASPLHKYAVTLPSVAFRLAVDWLARGRCLYLLSLINERLLVIETDAAPGSAAALTGGRGGASGSGASLSLESALVRNSALSADYRDPLIGSAAAAAATAGRGGLDAFLAAAAAEGEQAAAAAAAGLGGSSGSSVLLDGLPLPADDVLAGSARVAERARLRARGAGGDGTLALAAAGGEASAAPVAGIAGIAGIVPPPQQHGQGSGSASSSEREKQASAAAAAAIAQAQAADVRWGVLDSVVVLGLGKAGAGGAAAGAAGTAGSAAAASAAAPSASAAEGEDDAAAVGSAGSGTRTVFAAYPGPDVSSSAAVPLADYAASRYGLALARAAAQALRNAHNSSSSGNSSGSSGSGAKPAVGSKRSASQAADGNSHGHFSSELAVQMLVGASRAGEGDGSAVAGVACVGLAPGRRFFVSAAGETEDAAPLAPALGRPAGRGAAAAAAAAATGAGTAAGTAAATGAQCVAIAFPTAEAVPKAGASGSAKRHHGHGHAHSHGHGHGHSSRHPCFEPSSLRLQLHAADAVSAASGLQHAVAAGFGDGFVRLWATCRLLYKPPPNVQQPGGDGSSADGSSAAAPAISAGAGLASPTAVERSGSGGGGVSAAAASIGALNLGAGASASPAAAAAAAAAAGIRHVDESFAFECSVAEAAAALSVTAIAMSTCKRYILAGTVGGGLHLYNATGLMEGAVARAGARLAASGATVLFPPAAVAGAAGRHPGLIPASAGGRVAGPATAAAEPQRLLLAAAYRTEERLPVWAVAFNPLSPAVFACGGRDRVAALWSTAFAAPQLTLAGHLSDVDALAFHPNGLYLATSSSDGSARIWDCASGDCVRLLLGASGASGGAPVHSSAVAALAWSPSGRYVATGDSGGAVAVWDVTSGAAVARFRGHAFAAPIRSLAFNAWGTTLASADATGRVCVWEVARALGGVAGTGSASAAASASGSGGDGDGGDGADGGGGAAATGGAAAGAGAPAASALGSASIATSVLAAPSARTKLVAEAQGVSPAGLGFSPFTEALLVAGASSAGAV